MPSINKEPNSNTTYLDSSSERSGIFSVASRNTEPSFEKQESVLDEMAKFVEIFIILPRMFSAFPWRNDRYHSLVNRLEDDCVRIIASICQKIFCLKSLDQPRCNCAIRCGTRSDKESHRHTMRIHGQMYFGVEPPFVRPIAWFPPRAPVASGCTLTWLASIISHSKSVSSTSASRIFSQIPLSRHRQNRRCTFFQFPYVSGKSRQGAPVRKIQNTPLINCRVSRALPPRVPFSPIVFALIFSHALSLISCRCCSLAIFLPPASFGDYYNTPLLTTPSR